MGHGWASYLTSDWSATSFLGGRKTNSKSASFLSNLPFLIFLGETRRSRGRPLHPIPHPSPPTQSEAACGRCPRPAPAPALRLLCTLPLRPQMMDRRMDGCTDVSAAPDRSRCQASAKITPVSQTGRKVSIAPRGREMSKRLRMAAATTTKKKKNQTLPVFIRCFG